jgi:aminoglycoside phosphotransferase (APT) family kinase protein
LELRDVAGGWDNQQWRLGAELAMRMPRTEQRWLPVLAPRLPLPTPIPVRVGEPSALFEHTWTIARWVDGEPADHAPITNADAAETLAGFLTALHQPAPEDAPANPTRGNPLAELRDSFTGAMHILADDPNADAAREIWEKAVAAPTWQGAPTWLHGDLHPANVVVRDGTLAGVIDFGELSAADPAADLSAAWILLPAGTATRFFDAYQRADEATVARARGWAVLRALHLLSIGRNGRLGLPGGKPTWEPAGRAALERALD